VYVLGGGEGVHSAKHIFMSDHFFSSFIFDFGLAQTAKGEKAIGHSEVGGGPNPADQKSSKIVAVC